MNEEQQKIVEQKIQKKAKGKQEIIDKERIKYEIAEELGLLEKVLSGDWKSLTSKEAGKIGGVMTAKKRKTDI